MRLHQRRTCQRHHIMTRTYECQCAPCAPLGDDGHIYSHMLLYIWPTNHPMYNLQPRSQPSRLHPTRVFHPHGPMVTPPATPSPAHPSGPPPASYRTMFSCCNSLRRDISRMAVLGTPSSSDSSRIFFNATTSPECLSLALYTTPYVPSPTFSSF